MDAFYFFPFFFWLTSLAGPSSIMLNGTGENGHPGLASNLRGKVSFLSQLSMMLLTDFS